MTLDYAVYRYTFSNCSRRCDGKFRVEEVEGHDEKDGDNGVKPVLYVLVRFFMERHC